MNLHWKLKSLAFKEIDAFSLNRTLYFLQKNVTRRSPIDISEGYKHWRIHQDHLTAFERPRIFEFGAGKHLAQNIFLSRRFESQTVVDLNPMLDLGLVNDAAMQLSQCFPDIPFYSISSVSDLERFYGIRYIAPLDASRTPFVDHAFDACISTDTLEHIPEESIVAIFRELRRTVRPLGLISAVIDYSDHYAYTDRRIGPLNYLQYLTEEFKRYNHRVHYQNRLRHYDYARIFAAQGFTCIGEEALAIAPRPARIAREFNCDEPTLCATRGTFLLQNPDDAN